MNKLKYLFFSFFSGVMPVFAQEGEDFNIIDQQLPELPNAVDSAMPQASYGFFDQYGAYIIVLLSAIILLLSFIILYRFVLRKSKVNFANTSLPPSQQQLNSPQDNLHSESTLQDAVKAFLIKTNFLQ